MQFVLTSPTGEGDPKRKPKTSAPKVKRHVERRKAAGDVPFPAILPGKMVEEIDAAKAALGRSLGRIVGRSEVLATAWRKHPEIFREILSENDLLENAEKEEGFNGRHR